MKILIFGCSGFISAGLIERLEVESHELVLFGRRPPSRNAKAEYVQWTLEMAVTDRVICASRDADVAVHLAHDFRGLAGAKRTIVGISRLVRRLENFGVRNHLFVSSYSAGPHATSNYGRSKYILEKKFLASPNNTVIRPGLVLGNGGLFGRIRKWAGTLPLLFLPDGGRAKLPIVTVQKLCEEMVAIVERKNGKDTAYNLFFKDFVSLRDLVVASVLSSNKAKPIIISIPSPLLLTVLTFAERLHVPLPFSSDNLRGLISNKNASHEGSLEGSLDLRDV